jgi:hypothetical protein
MPIKSSDSGWQTASLMSKFGRSFISPVWDPYHSGLKGAVTDIIGDNFKGKVIKTSPTGEGGAKQIDFLSFALPAGATRPKCVITCPPKDKCTRVLTKILSTVDTSGGFFVAVLVPINILCGQTRYFEVYGRFGAPTDVLILTKRADVNQTKDYVWLIWRKMSGPKRTIMHLDPPSKRRIRRDK